MVQDSTRSISGARKKLIISNAEQYAKNELSTDGGGHDWWHVHRVRNSSVALALEEGADAFITELTALLHDIGDFKISGSLTAGESAARKFCYEHQLDEMIAEHVASTVRLMSFKGAGVADSPLTLEGRCVQDADRLDAIGAIGIGRAFSYGGKVSRLMWNPDKDPEKYITEEAYRSGKGTTIDHFHEKLLLLKDRMSTSAGRRRAQVRHEFMVKFLTEFADEWSCDERI